MTEVIDSAPRTYLVMSMARRLHRRQYKTYGKGVAGNSDYMQSSCETALACKPVRALQGLPTPQAA